MNILSAIYRFLSGYAFAVLLIAFLFLLTLLGTLEQMDQSLFEVQKKYFESYFILEHIEPATSPLAKFVGGAIAFFATVMLAGRTRGVTRVVSIALVLTLVGVTMQRGMTVPLPGVALLLGLFFLNLVLGGIVRIRKRGATAGIIVAHVGILYLLVAGLVEWGSSTKGHMSLVEGEESHEYVSFFEWEILVFENGDTTEYVIPGDEFIGLGADGASRTFRHPRLPFQLAIDTVHKNSQVVSSEGSGDVPSAAGVQLRGLPQEKEAEGDVAGCYVTAWAAADRSDAKRGILWGRQRSPFTYSADGKLWLVHMQRRTWPVPFQILLEDFRKEEHPGTTMARSYESDVVMTDGGATEKITISMNNPLRHRGYTLFQSSYGETTNGRPYSQFSVVRNPADAWPLYACYVIAAGLLLHFVRKLLLFVRNASARNAA